MSIISPKKIPLDKKEVSSNVKSAHQAVASLFCELHPAAQINNSNDPNLPAIIVTADINFS